MTKTKTQQAQEYAEKRLNKLNDTILAPYDEKSKVFNFYDVMQAHIDGYTACEQSMWRSVGDELPEVGKELLLFIKDEYNMRYGFYIGWRSSCKDWFHVTQGQDVRSDSVKYWMYIPSLPDTNTEKNG